LEGDLVWRLLGFRSFDLQEVRPTHVHEDDVGGALCAEANEAAALRLKCPGVVAPKEVPAHGEVIANGILNIAL
jgi:hypothetical protein